jgi:uncharacterized protein YbjT (DUF2867 family)
MIVVTGASGNVGRALTRALVTSGRQVTAVTRTSPAPAGARHVKADLGEPDSLAPALAGAEALFLLVAGDNPEGILDVAKSAGVRRVVLVSSQGAGTRPQAYQRPAGFEAAVRGSGLDWTVLRPGGLNSNALAWATTVRARRTVVAPFGDVALPSVDPADVAEVAAAVLPYGVDHAGRTYELTGPVPTTPRQRARAIGDALGEPVRFVEQDVAQARAQMLRVMPEPVVDATLGILGSPTEAERRISPDIERLHGRPPRPFAEWAARSVAAFR